MEIEFVESRAVAFMRYEQAEPGQDPQLYILVGMLTRSPMGD